MVEHRSIEEESKTFSTSTLIPPPSVNGGGGGTLQVYITKLNADLSTNFSSPHAIQDPAYVCYDEEVLNIKLSEPTLSDCFRVHRYALLDVLNEIMNDYGGKESSYNFMTFKYYLLAACATTVTSFPNGNNVFYENFILDIVIHSLRMAMKCINDKLARISGGVRLLRPLFSPSTTFLLKTLHAFRRSFELNKDLTSLGMLNEQSGSIIGCMLRERNELLGLADINLNYIRCTEGTNFKLEDVFRMEGGKYVDDRHFDMNALQTKMTAFRIILMFIRC